MKMKSKESKGSVSCGKPELNKYSLSNKNVKPGDVINKYSLSKK